MRNASKFSVYNRSGMKVEFMLSWMSGSQKMTMSYSQSMSLFQLDDNTEVTVEGKIGSTPTSLMFNYKHNASPLAIEVYQDGSYSTN